VLHVTNGDSTAVTLRHTSLGGDVLPWRDALCEGPVPRLPPDELRAIRARFLAAAGWGGEAELRHDMEERDATVRAHRPLALWFEHDLYDQLQLLQVLALVADEPDGIELIQADDFLGPLDAEQLEALWPTRVPVTDELLALAVAAWDAVRAPDPAELEAFLERDTSALPFLAPALRRLLEQLPGADGLSRSERQLLELLRDGPRTRIELFLGNQAREEAPFDGDTWVYARIDALDGLVATEGDRVALTDAGRSVLAGVADARDVIDVDRWVGGIHVHSERQ
jgi:hypothetical protein